MVQKLSFAAILMHANFITYLQCSFYVLSSCSGKGPQQQKIE